MAEIKLTGKHGAGKVTLVDDADLPLLSAFRWTLGRSGYARTHVKKADGRTTTVDLHRLLTDARGGLYQDHVNGNRLDNRRCNLRPATVQQNAANKKVHRNSKTGLKGVRRAGQRFQAVIHRNGKQHHLGYYPTAQLAAAAYNGAARALYGVFARLNDLTVPPPPGEVAHAAD